MTQDREPLIRLALLYEKRDEFERAIEYLCRELRPNEALWVYDQVWDPQWNPPDWFKLKGYARRRALHIGRFAPLVLLMGALGILWILLFRTVSEDPFVMHSILPIELIALCVAIGLASVLGFFAIDRLELTIRAERWAMTLEEYKQALATTEGEEFSQKYGDHLYREYKKGLKLEKRARTRATQQIPSADPVRNKTLRL